MSSVQGLFDYFAKAKVRTVAVVDNQWGDAGKGKIVDCLAEWADIIARGTGGANAGHTIKLGGEEHIFHLVPSGILWDSLGKINVIGRGVAFDPRVCAGEVKMLRAAGNRCQGLRISHNALLVLPLDIALDRLKEAGRGESTIGTTGRGIGPAYESRLGRIALSVNDLLNRQVFKERLRRNYDARLAFFRNFDPALVKEVMQSDALENGAFYAGPEKIFDLDAIVAASLFDAQVFKDLIVDTDALMRREVGKKRVLLEGAQGVLLSVLHGTYPYVTSSDCSLAGLAEGVGLRTEDVDYTFGVVKAPYMTRVGKGSFPTEFGGAASAAWCAQAGTTKQIEGEKFPKAWINSSNELEQGIAVRQAGNEYGATTGRLRRTGWLDLPLLRHAAKFGSTTLALTKVDVLDECKVIRLCTQYRYEGEPYRVGDQTLARGGLLDIAIMDQQVLDHSVPIYDDFPGWCSKLGDVRSKDDLPLQLRAIILAIEKRAGVKVVLLSVGADRDQTIVLL